jgi:hypothetical protein
MTTNSAPKESIFRIETGDTSLRSPVMAEADPLLAQTNRAAVQLIRIIGIAAEGTACRAKIARRARFRRNIARRVTKSNRVAVRPLTEAGSGKQLASSAIVAVLFTSPPRTAV